jgi:hypothetical protein
VPNGGARKDGFTSEPPKARWVVNTGVTPQNHMAQEGVCRGQWLIPLAMKPQWVCTS